MLSQGVEGRKGKGKEEGELAFASQKVSYLRPKIGRKMMIGQFDLAMTYSFTALSLIKAKTEIADRSDFIPKA